MPEIQTLYDAYVHGVKLTMRCADGNGDGLKRQRACSYRQELDVLTLLATRGPSFPLSRLAERLMCPRCRSRRIAVGITFPSESDRNAAVARMATLQGRW